LDVLSADLYQPITTTYYYSPPPANIDLAPFQARRQMPMGGGTSALKPFIFSLSHMYDTCGQPHEVHSDYATVEALTDCNAATISSGHTRPDSTYAVLPDFGRESRHAGKRSHPDCRSMHASNGIASDNIKSMYTCTRTFVYYQADVL
jgi:hypothetical protein